MNIEIKNRFNGKIILCGEYDSIKNALENNKNADLRGADLGGADLRGADLRGADLGGADLRAAKNIKIPIISIQGTKDFVYFINNHIKIGCEYHHIEYWKIAYDIIGKEYNYKDEEIKEYKSYIDICKNIGNNNENKF